MNTLFRKFILNSTGFVLVFLFISSISFGGTWRGTNNGNWFEAANWKEGTVPLSGDNISFENSPTFYPIINVGENIVIGTLNLDGHTFTQNGGSLTMNYFFLGKANNSDGLFLQNSGTLYINGNYKNIGGTFNSVGGTIQFSGSAGATQEFAGINQFNNVIISSNGDPKFDKSTTTTIYIRGNYTNNNTTLDNSQGTVIFNGTGTQTIYSASTNNTFYNLEIDQTGGDISFTSDLTILNNFTNTSGSPIEENGNDVAAGSGDPLPVELTTFSASVVERNVELVWITATEVNNYGFEIERKILKQSLHGGSQVHNDNWVKIGFAEGHGNSNSPKYYTYKDKLVESSGKYIYRLKQVDIDGTFEYSDEVEVNIGAPNNFELSQNYPNPFNPTTSISYSIPSDGHVTLSIYDILGNEVAQLEDGFRSAGNYSHTFDATDLTSGIYFYTIKSAKYVETKKMMLVK